MGWLTRIQLSDLTPEDERESEAALRKLYSRHPTLVNDMRELSRIETRKYLRAQGLSLQSFPGEVCVVTMPDELIAAPQRYGEKLGKALYYLHSGRIVPRTGGLRVKALSNAQFMSPKFPLDGFDILRTKPLVARSGRSLEDQFSYRYTLVDGGGAAGFLVQFRESTAITILVFEDAKAYEERAAKRREEREHSTICGLSNSGDVAQPG